jgi:hypothetical protein
MNLYQYGFTSVQNYIPIYKEFFKLNNTNYNAIQLNHEWQLKNIIEPDDRESRTYEAVIEQTRSKKVRTVRVYIKEAPILDPFKVLTGEMIPHLDYMTKLPSLSSIDPIHPKTINPYNSAYVDGLFNFINGILIPHGFLHGVEFYGSFLSIKKNYSFNIVDDLDYLVASKYFKKNNGVLYTVPEHLFVDTQCVPLTHITIGPPVVSELIDIIDISEDIATIDEPKEPIIDTVVSSEGGLDIEPQEEVSFRNSLNFSSDDDSSEQSDTDLITYNELEGQFNDIETDKSLVTDSVISNNPEHSKHNTSMSDTDTSSYSTIEEDDDDVFATIPFFPVQLICIEKCNDTLDSLLGDNELCEEELFACMAQIIFILITYQRLFGFTHNDLHTNNIVFTDTNKKFILYTYNNVTYKIPTYGKIYKIIDFGRSIFNINGHLVCSDSYNIKEDAYSQYNFGPCYNSSKPVIEPNYSFDLCRLACSMIDVFIHDYDKIKGPTEFSKLLLHLCMDDSGSHILYKKNGDERYPDFKLYKMIARTVHQHTPENVLSLGYFQKYACPEKIPSNLKHHATLNIDQLITQVKSWGYP